MPITDTPLRYPGGKSQLTPLAIELLRENNLFYGEYAEPFAGGAGIAIHLLLNDYVSRIWINDIDPAIYAFWYSVIFKTEEFCELVSSATLSMSEWYKQREIFITCDANENLKLGFATLYLNRTNRSGILKGGVIGGKEQLGKYKLDCRFNKIDLIRKIRRIGSYRDQIVLRNLDALAFLDYCDREMSDHSLINIDPPYYGKGPELYTNFYKHDDHAVLARKVSGLNKKWMVTYDDELPIREAYSKFPMYGSKLNYFAQEKRIGIELAIFHSELKVPNELKGAKIDPSQLLFI